MDPGREAPRLDIGEGRFILFAECFCEKPGGSHSDIVWILVTECPVGDSLYSPRQVVFIEKMSKGENKADTCSEFFLGID